MNPVALTCVVPYLDLLTAARLRATCRDVRDIVDAIYTPETFDAYARQHSVMIYYIKAPGDHRRIYHTFPDISNVTCDDLVSIFRTASGMTAPCTVWRGLFPIHRIARLVSAHDVITRGNYCIELTRP